MRYSEELVYTVRLRTKDKSGLKPDANCSYIAFFPQLTPLKSEGYSKIRQDQ